MDSSQHPNEEELEARTRLLISVAKRLGLTDSQLERAKALSRKRALQDAIDDYVRMLTWDTRTKGKVKTSLANLIYGHRAVVQAIQSGAVVYDPETDMLLQGGAA